MHSQRTGCVLVPAVHAGVCLSMVVWVWVLVRVRSGLRQGVGRSGVEESWCGPLDPVILHLHDRAHASHHIHCSLNLVN